MSLVNLSKEIMYERYYDADKMRFMGKPLSEIRFDPQELDFVYVSFADLEKYRPGKFKQMMELERKKKEMDTIYPPIHEREQDKDDSGMIINWE